MAACDCKNSFMKLLWLCAFWQTGQNQSHKSSSDSSLNLINSNHVSGFNSFVKTASSMVQSLFHPRNCLRLDPANHIYLPYEPGKQVKSAIKLTNTSSSHVAFKFQMTATKSCYMRHPGGILAPGESVIATVFKFVEQLKNNGKPIDKKSKVKFRLICLKVKEGIDYYPEMFDDEMDQVITERTLQVVYIDAERPSPRLDKLKRQLAEAEAAFEACKKPPEDARLRISGECDIADEWKVFREKLMARKQVEASGSE
ncbi:hypothetical protein ACFE04_022807 [Oxalis oulophora]